jgi:branched-chain amino acid aminotransferase
MWCYVDGRFVEDAHAAVPLTDRSFLYGDGCFEGVGIREGKILHLDDHVARLAASARVLRIDMPVPAEELRELLLAVAGLNGMRNVRLGYLRPLLSRGSGYLGLRNTRRLGQAHLYIIPQLEPVGADELDTVRTFTAATTGIAAPPPSSLDPRVKSNNYLPHILALLEAYDRGADVAIHCDGAGFVTEAHAMNIFCVRGGRILCPPEAMALAGITRAHVMAAALNCGYDVAEALLTRYDLLTAEEVFLTSSLDAIAALSEIDGVPLPGPLPGPVTHSIRSAYVSRAVEQGAPVPSRQQSREISQRWGGVGEGRAGSC